jgi:predicted acylesterase/phospholipase RssA
MRMADVAMATSAAPTIYRALPMGGYMLIDGGVWTNNPLMLAMTEAMICYDVPRERIKVLSIGCGDDPCYVTRRMVGGGLWEWRKMVGGAMRAQSLAAVTQARVLLAPVNVVRIEPSLTSGPIELRLSAGGERTVAGSQRGRNGQPRSRAGDIPCPSIG